MNILIATNHDCIKYTTVMLYSLFTHNDTDISVYLPHTNRLSEEDIQLLDRFVGLFPSKKLHPFEIQDDFDKKVITKNGVTIEA